METTLATKINRVATTLRFLPATIDTATLLNDFCHKYPTRSCDFSVGGIIIWKDFFNYKYCIYADTLFLKGEDSRGTFFHQPIGSLTLKKAHYLISEYCKAYGIKERIIYFSETTPEETETFDSSHPDNLADWREYLYNIEQFLHFQGKKMEKKRNHLNYFMNHFSDFETEMLDGTQTEELLAFNDKFNLYHQEDPTFEFESNAIGEAIKEYLKYPFFGLLIKYKGEIIGYTFGEAIADTFIIHAEKGDIEYRGVYQALSSLLSQKIKEFFPDVRYLNREDDMGNEYLRKSKLSYHPALYISKNMFIENE